MKKFLAIVLWLAACSAHAGTYLELGHEQADKATQTSQKIWAEGGKLRVEVKSAGGTDSILLFKDDALYTVDPRARRYARIDRATVVRMGSQLKAARAQLEAQLASMPKEQRAMMESMMAGAMMPAAAPKRDLRETNRKEEAAGYACKVWEVLEAGAKVTELCVVDPQKLPAGADLAASMKTFGALAKEMAESMGVSGALDDSWTQLETVKGWPVITRHFAQGKMTDELALRLVREEKCGASPFEVPAGYVQQELHEGMRGR
ncbi:MAG: DUF4412 domain-containing protein [Myxococcota bacterium]